MQNAGGKNLLVPLGSMVKNLNGILTMNDTGSYVWAMLQQERSLDDLVDAVAERFVVEREHAYTDVRYFLDELSRMGLLA